jgi:type IV pilus biogenesis protein CpaD/CtpE
MKILLIAALLAGCASTPPPATQTVEVPVYVPCVVKRPQQPVYEFDKLPADASDGRKVLALARDWVRARAYELKLETALAGCIQAYPSSAEAVRGESR